MLTCVGSLSRVRLRLAGSAEHGTWEGAFEIIALTGTLSQDGNHLHLAVADQQGHTVGGHLAEGCTVRTTVEVVVATDVGGMRQRNGGWIDRFSAETHLEFRPAGASRCQSLLLAGQAMLGADLHEWLFLLATA